MQNLDFYAAKYAGEIVEQIVIENVENPENALNQALSILAEQGPFAMLLWCESRGRAMGAILRRKLAQLLREIGLCNLTAQHESAPFLRAFNQQICSQFLKYAAARQLFERVLVYARYYAATSEDAQGDD